MKTLIRKERKMIKSKYKIQSKSIQPFLNHRVILEKCTRLNNVQNKRILVLVDEQNLSIAANKLGFRLQYDLLSAKLKEIAKRVRLHIFIASEIPDTKYKERFEAIGYKTHVKIIRYIPINGGRFRTDSNIDNLFAFWAGIFCKRNSYDVLILASGDFGLSGELASAFRQQKTGKPVQIMTLSLPGSTAQDLDARINPDITANLEIGLDVLQPQNSLKCKLSGGHLGDTSRLSKHIF